MALLNILKEGEEALRKKSRPLDKITERTCTLLDDMLETMRNADGVGLAAVQVGILRRAVVIDCGDGYIELINPEITSKEGSQFEEEGCLSLPGQSGVTCRPAVVRVKAQDRNGKWCVYKGEGLKARCFCHEIDHLDGRLYPDIADRMMTPEEVAEYYAEDDK